MKHRKVGSGLFLCSPTDRYLGHHLPSYRPRLAPRHRPDRPRCVLGCQLDLWGVFATERDTAELLAGEGFATAVAVNTRCHPKYPTPYSDPDLPN